MVERLRDVLHPGEFQRVQGISQAAYQFEMSASYNRFDSKLVFLVNKQLSVALNEHNTTHFSQLSHSIPGDEGLPNNSQQLPELPDEDENPNFIYSNNDLFTNLSGEVLTNEETQLLSMGPKFKVNSFPKEKADLIREYKNGFQRLIHSVRWHCQVQGRRNFSESSSQSQAVLQSMKKEVILPKLLPEVEDVVKRVATNYTRVLRRIEQTRTHSNLTTQEWRTLKSLKTKKLVFDMSDKGGDFCVINSDCYHRAMLKELNESGKFRRVAKIPIQRIETRLNNLWRSLCIKYSVDKYFMRHYLSKNSIFGSIRGLVKTHKLSTNNSELKLRLVINTIGTPGYSLAWFLHKSISPVVTEHVTNTSSQKVMEKIKNMGDIFSSYWYPFSLDVVDMFHSIPKREAIQCLVDVLIEKNFTLLGISPVEIGTLLDVVLRSNQFEYNNQLYIQYRGVPIGNRLSGLLADVFISKLQSQVLSKYPGLPCFRYVDDFLLFSVDEVQADEIKNDFNETHESIKFEIEKPQQDGSIPFLDFSIRIVNGTPLFVYYQKPSKKPMFVHARSALPKSTFHNFISNEMIRRSERCSVESNKRNVLQNFNQILSLRGHKLNPFKILKRQNKSNDPRFFLTVPFINNQIDNLIKSALRPLGIKLCVVHKTRTLNSYMRARERTSQNECTQCGMQECGTTHVVYQMTCAVCQDFYIGSTTQKLHVRVRQHMHMRSSMVNQHNCRGTWNVKILYRCHHVQKLRLMEAMYIKERKPRINAIENLFLQHILL
jgi:hypothetical protein